MLDESNSSKIRDDLMGIMLQLHLYGRDRDICKSAPRETIPSKNGADAIEKALYTRDQLALQ